MKLEEEKIKDFFEIIKTEAIRTVFQPIVDLSTGDIFAYEALSRITLTTSKLSIDQLFCIADHLEQVWNLEKLCRSKALAALEHKPKFVKAFVNVDANVIMDSEFVEGFTKEYLKRYNLSTNDVVFEITERTSVEQEALFKQSVEHYKKQGFQIAIDDAGSGYSNLNRISVVEPKYIKIDQQLIRGINENQTKKSMVAIIAKYSEEMNYTVIAEGIETEEELKTVIQMGIKYGQGYFLCRPESKFQTIPNNIKKLLVELNANKINISVNPSFFGQIGTICKKGVTMEPNEMATYAYECFAKNPELTEISVVDEHDTYYGMLTREFILSLFGGRYGFNLHHRNKIYEVMKKDSLVVNKEFSIENVSKIAMERMSQELYDAVVVLENDKYYGIATIKDLLSAAVSIQIKRAIDTNPLTSLPGNIIIEQKINALIGVQTFYAIMYLDLDNFKAYNDAYGFNNGDKMITALADSIKKSTYSIDTDTNHSSSNNFVGHIGGDDFVVISNNKNIYENAELIINAFSDQLPFLYNQTDLERKFNVSKNRNGLTENFPLATLSIAIVTNKKRLYHDINKLSNQIVIAKKKAKQLNGNSIVIM